MKMLCLTILPVPIGMSMTLLAAQAEVHLQQVPAAVAGDRFDVVSLRQNRSGDAILSLTGGVRGRYSATNVTAGVLLRAAHRVQPTQIVGLPEWAAHDRWDMVATIPEGPATGDRQMALLRNMLKDRFNLAFHVETRELPVSGVRCVGPYPEVDRDIPPGRLRSRVGRCNDCHEALNWDSSPRGPGRFIRFAGWGLDKRHEGRQPSESSNS